MSREELLNLSSLLTAQKLRENSNIIAGLYPDSGPLSRDKYKKHLEFFSAGLFHMERAAIAGNRTGKTLMSCYETVLHLTGQYPDWWEGRRFNRPVDWWSASDTGETTRDILQLKLMGPSGSFGTGLIPKKYIIGEPTHRRGIAGALDTVKVQHKSGGVSYLSFKSYDQGREKFQGTKKDGVQLDEEPPASIYFEALTRLSATVPGEDDGIMLCTFTPLEGMSTVVLLFLNESSENRFFITMGMEHAPHLSKETIKKLMSTFPEHEREARLNGTPQLGSGAIYPYPDSDIVISDFKIPDHWPIGYGLDIGWSRTSAGFHAIDLENDRIYRISEHYMGKAEPIIHATAIKARGEWIQGVVDPAARGRSQVDGQRLIDIYCKPPNNLKLTPAKNAVEAGIFEMQQRMATGRYKVFASCTNFLTEKKLYRRDENGKIVKENDHAMDDARYFVMSGLGVAKAKPQKPKIKTEMRSASDSANWMD